DCRSSSMGSTSRTRCSVSTTAARNTSCSVNSTSRHSPSAFGGIPRIADSLVTIVPGALQSPSNKWRAVMRKGTAATWRLFTMTLVLGMALGIGLDRAVSGQQGGSINRTLLLTTDITGTPDRQALIAMVEAAPHSSAPKHLHHGLEVGYVLE